MGELIDFCKILRERKLKEWVGNSQSILDRELPSPEFFGWVPTHNTQGKIGKKGVGLPTRYYHPSLNASIGYVPGRADIVYLEYQNDKLYWQTSLEELALGVEMGTLEESITEW